MKTKLDHNIKVPTTNPVMEEHKKEAIEKGKLYDTIMASDEKKHREPLEESMWIVLKQ